MARFRVMMPQYTGHHARRAVQHIPYSQVRALGKQRYQDLLREVMMSKGYKVPVGAIGTTPSTGDCQKPFSVPEHIILLHLQNNRDMTVRDWFRTLYAKYGRNPPLHIVTVIANALFGNEVRTVVKRFRRNYKNVKKWFD